MKLSSNRLSDSITQEIFDQMISSVSQNALIFLCALSDFVSRPMSFCDWTDNEIEHIVCFQRAQESLTQSIQEVVKLRELHSFAKGLKDVRKLYTEIQDLPTPETRQKGLRWLHSKTISLYCSYMGDPTSVLNIKGRLFAESSYTGRWTMCNGSKALWNTAACLRATALRFAVNPIYTSLMITGQSDHFSPINFLVHTSALFEEVGNYPHWDKLPLRVDILEPFVTTPKDPQHGPARFVLHSMIPPSSPDDEDRASGSQKLSFALRPDWRLAANDFAVSATHKELVKKVHQVSSSTFWVTKARLGVFKSNDPILQTFATNPLSNIQLRANMYMGRDENYLTLMGDPNMVLERYVPQAVEDSPRVTFIRSIPQLLSTSLATYIAELFQRFGDISKATASISFAQMEIVKSHVLNLKSTLLFTWNRDSKIDIHHILMAIAIYMIRLRYVPSFGGMLINVRLRDMIHCFKHPAQYLEVINGHATSIFSMAFLKWGMLCMAHDLLCIRLKNRSALEGANTPNNLAMPLTIKIYFDLMLTHRSIYQLGYHTATTIATGLLMFRDAESVKKLVLFSGTFWASQLQGLGMIAVALGSQQRNMWTFIFLFLLQLGALVLFARLLDYFGIFGFFSWVMSPVLDFLWHALETAMLRYGRVIQISGMLAFAFMVYRTFWMVDGWMWDPFNLTGSLRYLHEANVRARRTLPAAQMMRIGCYPLGALPPSSQVPATSPAPPPHQSKYYPTTQSHIETEAQTTSTTRTALNGTYKLEDDSSHVKVE